MQMMGTRAKGLGIALVGLVVVGACRPTQGQQAGGDQPGRAGVPQRGEAVKPGARTLPSLLPASGECLGPDVGAPPAPRVKPYTIGEDLGGLANPRARDLFAALRGTGRQKLARNLFTVAPYHAEQLFYIYQTLDDAFEDGIQTVPLVTVDGFLHLYHYVFDYSLRVLERERLTAAAEGLTRQMAAAAEEAYGAAPSGMAREAATRAWAYFLVGSALLSDTQPPQTPATELANLELGLIREHAGIQPSPLLGCDLDYSQFIPRGHYTRGEDLKRYFLGMTWYGQASWQFPRDLEKLSDKQREDLALSAATSALVAKLLLGRSSASDDLWHGIYEPIRWFVGGATDATPPDLWPLVQEAYGGEPTLEQLGGKAAALRLAALVAERIEPPPLQSASNKPFEHTPAIMRFMPQRFIPDSYAMQLVMFDRVGVWPRGRFLPKGLDVMSALGSNRAYQILTQVYHEDRFENYATQMEAARRWMRERPAEQWVSNMYWGWLWVLAAVVEPKGEGWPSFMAREPWTDKQLWTALASWAELRHDTILYGQQPYGVAGAAPPGGPEEKPRPLAYVEPDVEAWRRLLVLADLTRQVLEAQGLLGEELRGAVDGTTERVRMLIEASEKELAGEPLDEEVYKELMALGYDLAALQLACVRAAGDSQARSWEEIPERVERHMAVVADVATDPNAAQVLEEAVGPAYVLCAVVPLEGKLYLAHGPVFSYWEFAWPMSDRLTDEKWQQMLEEGKAPPHPEWAAGFLVGPPK